MKGSHLSLPQIVRQRWKTFLLSGTATAFLFFLGYWAQPSHYRVFGLYSPKKTEPRAVQQQSTENTWSPAQAFDAILNILFLRGHQLSPEATFIKNDELLQAVIQQLEIEDGGGNPASPRSLRRRLILSDHHKGNAVKIALYDPDPELAKKIVDQLMARYVEYYSAQTPESSISFTQLIQPHLVNAETLSKQTQQALYQMQLGSSQPPLSTNSRAGDQTLQLQSMGISVQQQLSTIDNDLAVLRQILTTATSAQKTLLQQLIQLGDIRKQLLIQLRETLNQPRDSDTLSQSLEKLERQGLSLKKELTLTQNLYNIALENPQTAWSVARSGEQNQPKVISPAMLSTQGTRLFLPWFVGLGFLSSLGIGTLATVVRDRRDQSLVSIHDIYARTQLPIFGLIPKFSGKELSIQALARQDNTEFQEFAQIMDGYTQTIQQFSLASLERIPQVLGFTSITTGEGKSLTLANLAYLFSKKGKKVLILEADLFHPGQAQYWQVATSAGLCDCIAGELQLGKALKRLHPNLDLLQGGYAQKNKDILLNSPGISILIQEFRTRYDHILVDAPALMDSSHGYLLANALDATLLVLRPRHVDRTHILLLRETLDRSGRKLWGMIINGSQQSSHSPKIAKFLQESQWDATIRLQKQKSASGSELSTLSAINPTEDAQLDSETDPDINLNLRELDPVAYERRQKQETYLYQLPLDELHKLVHVLWDDWSHDIELLLEQEEEVVQQSRLVRDLKAQVERGNPYLKLSSELQLKEEQEKLNVLADAYIGQRSVLVDEKEDLRFYLEILFARTDAEYIPSVLPRVDFNPSAPDYPRIQD